MTTTIEYTLMAGASNVSNRDIINRIPIPSDSGWYAIAGSYRNLSSGSGFEAVSFIKGNEIVISFAASVGRTRLQCALLNNSP